MKTYTKWEHIFKTFGAYMQTFIILVVLLICYILFVVNKKRYPNITLRSDNNSLLYQYITDAHCLVIETIGIDPLLHPDLFQQALLERMPSVNAKIEALRAQYLSTIAQDTQYGKTLQNYDYWLKQRHAWNANKNGRLRLIR